MMLENLKDMQEATPYVAPRITNPVNAESGYFPRLATRMLYRISQEGKMNTENAVAAARVDLIKAIVFDASKTSYQEYYDTVTSKLSYIRELDDTSMTEEKLMDLLIPAINTCDSASLYSGHVVFQTELFNLQKSMREIKSLHTADPVANPAMTETKFWTMLSKFASEQEFTTCKLGGDKNKKDSKRGDKRKHDSGGAKTITGMQDSAGGIILQYSNGKCSEAKSLSQHNNDSHTRDLIKAFRSTNGATVAAMKGGGGKGGGGKGRGGKGGKGGKGGRGDKGGGRGTSGRKPDPNGAFPYCYGCFDAGAGQIAYSPEHLASCPNRRAPVAAAAAADTSKKRRVVLNEAASKLTAKEKRKAGEKLIAAAAADGSDSDDSNSVHRFFMMSADDVDMSETETDYNAKMREYLGEDWDKFDVAKKSYTATAFLAAANVLTKAQKMSGLEFHHILVDSGANHHIINDLRWFKGFNDLRDVTSKVSTGSGSIKCHKRGTATLHTTDSKGNKTIIILEDALYIPECPFCIISQGALGDATDQGLAGFNRPICSSETIMTIRTLETGRRAKISLSRVDGLDYLTAFSPGTLGGYTAKDIKSSADSMKTENMRIHAGGHENLISFHCLKKPFICSMVSEFTRGLISVKEGAAYLLNYSPSFNLANGTKLSASLLSPHEAVFAAQQTTAEPAEVEGADQEMASSDDASDSDVKGTVPPASISNDGEEAGLPPDGGIGEETVEPPADREHRIPRIIRKTMEELHKIFGHAGQAKLDAFLKTRHEFEVKGSKVLGRCDICEKAKHTRSHVPGANAPILPDQPNVVHVDTTFPGMPSLNGAICAHDFLCGRTGQVATFCVASKGNFLVVLQTAIQQMYTQYGQTLHIIDSDNAPEFGRGITGDEEIIEFMLRNNFYPMSSAPYKHNQVPAERVHRTLGEGMRALLEQSGCPSAFWALARLYFCELTNVLPNNRATELWKAMGHSGPCSAIGLLRKTGRVSAWWARPFGCRCYYTAPGDAKLGGVVRRGNPGIFVGLAKHFNSKGYLVYVPGRTDLVISQDVTFFPEEFPFRENAIEWDEQTRRGKWASGLDATFDSSGFESVIQKTNDYTSAHKQGPVYTSNFDNPDNDFSALQGPKLKHKQSGRKELSRKVGLSTKGIVTVTKVTAAEVREWTKLNCKIQFLQGNHKSGKSLQRYISYQHCTTLQQFFEEFPQGMGDMCNDISKGLCKVSLPSGGAPDVELEPSLAHVPPAQSYRKSKRRRKKGDSSSSSSSSESEPEVTQPSKAKPDPALRRSARNAVMKAVTALSMLVADKLFVSSHQTIALPQVFLHGVLISAVHNAHKVIHNEGYSGMLKDAKIYIQDSSIEPAEATLCYVDLLKPFCDRSDAFGYQWESKVMDDEDERNQHVKSTFDELCFLYADGSEESLVSMQDILTGVKTPWTIMEALNSPQSKEWKASMVAEWLLLKSHKTYEWVDESEVKGSLVSSKVVFRLKLDSEGKPARYKSRITARGFSQRYGVNYKETFQPVARLEAVRTFIAAAVSCGLPIWQLDFEGAYLQGKADFPIYMSFPKELRDIEGIDWPVGKVALLRKSLYGLKQAGNVWWATLSEQLIANHFVPCDAEPCCWIYNRGGVRISMILHVDDALVTSNDMVKARKVLKDIDDVLHHTMDDKPASWYLGMKFDQEINSAGVLTSVVLSQKSYIEQLCKQNSVEVGKGRPIRTPCTPIKLSKEMYATDFSPATLKSQAEYRSTIGALLFLTRCTMPQISFAVGRLGRFTSQSGPEHWKELKHLCKYLGSIKNYGIRYSRPPASHQTQAAKDSLFPSFIVSSWNRNKSPHFQCYTDSDFAGCPDSSRSTSGGVITWMGAAICWMSSLQACVTLSTAEAEMVALSKGAQEVIWLRRFIGELLGQEITVPTNLLCDNMATLHMIDKRVYHARTKHIKLRQNFVREHKDSGELNPIHVATDINWADGFTKVLNQDTMDKHSLAITGMKNSYY